MRYALHGNRRDCLDAALVLVAQLKLPLVPRLLKSRWLRNEKKLVELLERVRKVMAEARAAGVMDLKAAQVAFKEHTCQLAPTTATGIEQTKVNLRTVCI